MKKYLNAVEQAKFHAEELLLIDDGLPMSLVQAWTEKIKTWESDRSAMNYLACKVSLTPQYYKRALSDYMNNLTVDMLRIIQSRDGRITESTQYGTDVA